MLRELPTPFPPRSIDGSSVAENDVWVQCPAHLPTPDNSVHIWRVWLDQSHACLGTLECLLSSEERERAARFATAQLRARFIAAHAMTRIVLARYLDCCPEELRFSCNPYGKPSLSGPLRFNLSHSESVALLAVSAGRELGVDVEHIRPDFAGLEIADRYFSPSETSELRMLPPPHRVGGFFACWTRKEAFIKAVGQGLSLPLDQFSVTVSPGHPPRLKQMPRNPAAEHRWSFADIPVGAGYAAAVVAEGTGWDLALYQFRIPT